VSYIRYFPLKNGRIRLLERLRGSALTALTVFLASLLFFISGQTLADDITSLKQQVNELESRVQQLEKLLDEKMSDQRWREPILWSRIQPGMTYEDIRKLLGKPARVEEAIFTTWFYHDTSRLHSHVWFDEGKVLGFEGLPKKYRKTTRLRP